MRTARASWLCKKNSDGKSQGAGTRLYSVVIVASAKIAVGDLVGSILAQNKYMTGALQLIGVNFTAESKKDLTRRAADVGIVDSVDFVDTAKAGLAASRNAGLALARGDWLSFPAAGGIFDWCFFHNINLCLEQWADKQEPLLVVGKCHSAHDKKTALGSLSGLSAYLVNPDEIPQVLSETLSHIVLPHYLCRQVGDGFSEVGTFTDRHFLANYLLQTDKPGILYCPASLYYSYMPCSHPHEPELWHDPAQYDQYLRDGPLSLLAQVQAENGQPPFWLQVMVARGLAGHVARFLDRHDEAALMLSTSQDRTGYIALLQAILAYISPQAIKTCELLEYGEIVRWGLLALCGQYSRHASRISIRNYDGQAEQVCLSFWYTGIRPDLHLHVAGQNRDPVASKQRAISLLGHTVLHEFIAWYAWPDDAQLEAFFNGKVAASNTVVYDKAAVKRRFSGLNDVSARLRLPIRIIRLRARSRWFAGRYVHTWLLMDRDTQADDNAEHFYRYLRAHHPEINAWFVLRQSSHDWERLQAAGFRLLAFGSIQHKLALLNADFLLSSHIVEDDIRKLVPKRHYGDMCQWQFVHLKHGVIKDDISGWLNGKDIRYFVTSASREYASICCDDSEYKFTTREVQLTGMPRHDHLLRQGRDQPGYRIVIMPTWRKSLVGEKMRATNDRTYNPAFAASDFVKQWLAVLHSPELTALAREFGLEVVFFPHANLAPYRDLFQTTGVTVLGHADVTSIQDLFIEAAVLITDYSSVAFEMAYLERPVIYYQFDRDYVLSGGHIAKPGYFDYERDGFGPVCSTAAEVMTSLDAALRSDSAAQGLYQQRMHDFFAYRDGQCCQRVYDMLIGQDFGLSDQAKEQ